MCNYGFPEQNPNIAVIGPTLLKLLLVFTKIDISPLSKILKVFSKTQVGITAFTVSILNVIKPAAIFDTRLSHTFVREIWML